MDRRSTSEEGTDWGGRGSETPTNSSTNIRANLGGFISEGKFKQFMTQQLSKSDAVQMVAMSLSKGGYYVLPWHENTRDSWASSLAGGRLDDLNKLVPGHKRSDISGFVFGLPSGKKPGYWERSLGNAYGRNVSTIGPIGDGFLYPVNNRLTYFSDWNNRSK